MSGRITGSRQISERPIAVQDRIQCSYWEDDTVMGWFVAFPQFAVQGAVGRYRSAQGGGVRSIGWLSGAARRLRGRRVPRRMVCRET